MAVGAAILLACMMAEAGTPWRRAMVSTVSPGATVTGVPPSQVQFETGAGLSAGAGATDPVTSGLTGALGRDGAATIWLGVATAALCDAGANAAGVYEAMPRPPPAMPELALAVCSGG